MNAVSSFVGKTALVIGGIERHRSSDCGVLRRGWSERRHRGAGSERWHGDRAAVRATGRQALFVEADVTRESDIANVMSRAVTQFGRIHAAVNNAGIEGRFGPCRTQPSMTSSASSA